jgi:glycosyltransferase involved in cell wall biosynthesis
MNQKIAFIITTFQRPELLKKCLFSLKNNQLPNFDIIVIDQSDDKTKEENRIWISKNYPIVWYFKVPFNSGLSYCRNRGVEESKKIGCDYVFLGSDSFLFNESIQKLNNLIPMLENSQFSTIGVELKKSTGGCGWEAFLRLIEGKSFELDFIDKEAPLGYYDYWKVVENGYILEIRACDITRNILLATTDSLIQVPWDENLKLGEHEDHAWQYKLKGYKTGWTNYIIVEKMTDRPDEYAKFRRINFNEGIKKLREKYSISGWISYVNLERAKEYYKKEG